MNFPNRLTLFRIILVPILVIVWLFPYHLFNIEFICIDIGPISISSLNLIILFIFCLASVTDLLDGKIARKKNLVTTFGRFMDPIADKLLVNTTFIILAYKGLVPIIPVILFIARDIVVDGCRMIASKNGIVVSAGILGKTKTVLQMFAIILVLLNNLPFELWNLPISTLLVWFAAFVSCLSGYSYFTKLKKYIFESM